MGIVGVKQLPGGPDNSNLNGIILAAAVSAMCNWSRLEETLLWSGRVGRQRVHSGVGRQSADSGVVEWAGLQHSVEWVGRECIVEWWRTQCGVGRQRVHCGVVENTVWSG